MSLRTNPPRIPRSRCNVTASSLPARDARAIATRIARFAALTCCCLALTTSSVQAFCGFYVSRADGTLHNRTSRAVLARDGQVTTITMANDYSGDPREFALVIPVPELIREHQVQVIERGLIDHLDVFTGPRLVEYHDEDPCRTRRYKSMMPMSAAVGDARQVHELEDGVEIEARFSIGEYDILILSAQESDGLARWLRRENYRLPAGAERILDSYLSQDMFFFVARVNLGNQERLGFAELRPLQVRYSSRRFMLPLRLGTLNADGPQDLVLWTLTRRGRVEPTNYQTVRMTTDLEIPTFVRERFGEVYAAAFDETARRNGMRKVVLEHAWDTGWCDPCATAPLRRHQLASLGASWALDPQPGAAGSSTYVTRLHVRYTAETFPDDLRLQETADRSNFQTRFVLRHAWSGDDGCAAAREYRRSLAASRAERLTNLQRLTGWNAAEVEERFAAAADWRARPGGTHEERDDSWWKRLWPAGWR